MRKPMAIFFLLLLSCQVMSHWVQLGVFKFNQSWIAKKTCENRFRPQLKCNGNCVLMKKMKQQEKENQQESPQLKLESAGGVLSSKTFFVSVPDFNTMAHIEHYPADNTGTPVDRSFSFFHPPRDLSGSFILL